MHRIRHSVQRCARIRTSVGSNAGAVVKSWMESWGCVDRTTFDTQTRVVQRLRQKLSDLEAAIQIKKDTKE